MQKFNAIALANTIGLIDLILHPLFHFWVSVSPRSYEKSMNLFVAGLQLNVTDFDINIIHIIAGTLLEAAAFWLLGFSFAKLYNYFSK